ncbi:CsbD family protein [Sphingomonas sp. NPDC019816]|uniref:CsbD family protein n=1 Tax=Sphingomonas sp. NPDC019816 TaxID=3390679 RepID=UPI003CFBF876
MNKHELHGGARYVGGKVEKAVGDVVDSRDWKVAGIADQVAGGAENLFGRAQSVAGDVADTTPSLIEHAREQVNDAADRSTDAVRRGARNARSIVRGHESIAFAVAAALGGYAIGWLVHGRRD